MAEPSPAMTLGAIEVRSAAAIPPWVRSLWTARMTGRDGGIRPRLTAAP